MATTMAVENAAETESNSVQTAQSPTSHSQSATQLSHQIIEIENVAAEQQPRQYQHQIQDQWKYWKSIMVIGLHSGALLGVAYRMPRRISPGSAIQSFASAGLALNGSGMHSFFGTAEDGTFAFLRNLVGEAPVNYQLYRRCMAVPITLCSYTYYD